MKSLLRVDKDSDADLSQLNDMNCTFTLNPDDFTHPKQVYDTPKDIVFEAFRCEVLNADTHSRSSTFTPHFQHDAEEGMFDPCLHISCNSSFNSCEDSEILSNLIRNSEKDLFSLLSGIPALYDRLSYLESSHSSLLSKYTALENNFSDLSAKCSSLEHKCSDLVNENITLKNDIKSNSSSFEKRHNGLAQYTRRNSLLAFRLRNVPMHLHGTAFSKWVANALSKLIPGLSITHNDIDTSHFLFYEYEGQNRFPVIVIKFIRRDLRNDILKKCNRQGYLGNSGVYFSDHLTVPNRKLLESAKEKYDDVWTDQCRIFVNCNGKKREIVEESDLSPNSNFVVLDDANNITEGHTTATSSTSQNAHHNTSSARNQFNKRKQHYKKRPRNRHKHNNMNSKQKPSRSYSEAEHWPQRNNQFSVPQNSAFQNWQYDNRYNNTNRLAQQHHSHINTNTNSNGRVPLASSSLHNHHLQTSNHLNANLPSLNSQMQSPNYTSLQTHPLVHSNVNNRFDNFQHSMASQLVNNGLSNW